MSRYVYEFIASGYCYQTGIQLYTIHAHVARVFVFFIPKTNHLDLESVEWLEEFLRQQNIPMVIVSHDREFLDQVCTKIVDAEGGMCQEYDGNYSRFLELKKGKLSSIL